MASKVRLNAEYNLDINKRTPKLKFPKEIQKDPQLMSAEQKLFDSRVSELRSNLRVLENQLGQKRQELKELRSKKKQLEKTTRLTKKEAKTIKRLVRSGAKSRIDYISIEKELSKLEGEYEATRLAIPRSKLAITEAKNKIKEKLKKFKSEAAINLQKTNTEIKKIQAKMVAEADKLEKTVVKSPVDGIIKNNYD